MEGENGARHLDSDASSEDVLEEVQTETPAARKRVYLRTVYPLNPGIPHFVDVPGGW